MPLALIPWLLGGAGLVGVTGFALGYGTQSTTDRLLQYGVIGASLGLVYIMVRGKK